VEPENAGESAVSGVVGEMLMLALVLILVSVFAASAGNHLPDERTPSISIKMSNTTGNVTLWHKGGDWVMKGDLSVIVMNETGAKRFTSSCPGFWMDPDTSVFDLGGTITVDHPVAGGEEVRLVTPRAVIFSGRVE
jgi:FlaG/FlaF family flagellin (archaellin)